jgi:hypothetical protein
MFAHLLDVGTYYFIHLKQQGSVHTRYLARLDGGQENQSQNEVLARLDGSTRKPEPERSSEIESVFKERERAGEVAGCRECGLAIFTNVSLVWWRMILSVADSS